MPVTLIMTSRDGILVPAWPADDEEMLRVPARQALTVTITRSTPSKLKAWYRALLQRLVDATDLWPDPQEAHRALLLRCGFFDSCMVTDYGDIRFTAPSTSQWDLIKWRAYLDRLWTLLVTEIVPEIGEKRLRDGIKAMIGLDLDDIWET